MTKYLVYGAWALVILALPDIWTIWRGGVLSGSPYDWDFLSSLGLSPYGGNRLRGFTQEPSYLGMVISVLYPICFIQLNQKWTLAKLLLVVGLWVCLVFSMSRTGLLTCALMSIFVLAIWPRRLLIFILILSVLAIGWHYFPQTRSNVFLSLSWVPLFNSSSLDGSTLVRSAHIVASLKAWLANPAFGLGLGQSGFILDQFYPAWYTPSSPEYNLWQPKAIFGGIPSLSFVPKVLAEIGLFGVGILFWWALPVIRGSVRVLKGNSSAKGFGFAFLGFLISSFGVDGYLYLPAWIVFGAFLGLLRSQISSGLRKTDSS